MPNTINVRPVDTIKLKLESDSFCDDLLKRGYIQATVEAMIY